MATTRRAPHARSSASPDAPGERRAAVFAGCGLALVTARHVVPAESAHLGETLWIAAAWLLLAAGWMLCRVRGLTPRFSFDRADLAVALLVGGHVIASIAVLISGGHRRAALNMLWEWVAVGVAVVLLRQWLTQSNRWPLLWRVLATAGVVLAALGVWQFAVTYPEYRAQVDQLTHLESELSQGALSAADSQQLTRLRRELGDLATATDPNLRFALRQRLMESTEPLACFALANTLAGVLAVALLLLLGGLAASIAGHDGTARALRIACPAMLVAGCLILTKSRTAWIGLLCGLLSWGAFAGAGKLLTKRSLRFVLVGLLMAAVLIGAAAAAGALDRLVLLEAPKSFRYRLEYWTGAWGVIRDHLWLGVGPGNFRQNYLRHKVAGSSEEVLDPHNLVLDVWANGGLIALAGLLLAGGVAIRHWRTVLWKREQATSNPDDGRLDAPLRRSAIICGGAGIGLVFLKSGLVEFDWSQRSIALLAAWIATSFLLPAVRVKSAALAATGIALGVHLLGAGGVAMPVVVTTLLLLWLGPVQATAETAAAPASNNSRRRALAGFVLFASLLLACLITGVIPATVSSLYVNAAAGAISQRSDVAAARRFLNDAKQADVLDPAPWVDHAQLEHDLLQHRGGNTAQEWAVPISLLSSAIMLDPENPKSHWLDAQWRLEFAERFPSPTAHDEAVLSAARAAERDPQHAGILTTLAEACAAAGRPAEAQAAARRALAIDALNLELGHLDKRLGPVRRGRLQEIIGE